MILQYEVIHHDLIVKCMNTCTLHHKPTHVYIMVINKGQYNFHKENGIYGCCLVVHIK